MISWSQFFPFSFPSVSLPTLSVPLNIQRRFLSFILKRTLGHLVRPGQLDTHQIDAQIGNGWIEISDIELADEAINELLHDLPVRLRGGSIGKISAKIPWTNILSSPLSVSIHALNLTFVLVPPQPVVVSMPPVGSKLAESVTNVAETFIHEELDSGDNKKLRDSIILGQALDEPPQIHFPGALDPFLVEDIDGTAGDLNASVPVLASLTERLLSRLKLSITNTSISLVHERSSKLQVTFPEISYNTEDSAQELGQVVGNFETRSVRILGFSVSMVDLSPSSPASFTAPSFPENPDFENESDGDDDATQTLMSQSIVSLSAASSIYHSVVSVRGSPERDAPGAHVESTVLSTKDPVLFQLITTRPTVVTNTSHEPIDPPDAMPQRAAPTITAQVRLGVFACAFQDWQVGRLLALSQFIPVRSSEVDIAPTPPSLQAKEAKEAFHVNFKLRSFVIVLLQDPLEVTAALDEFLTRPLAPVPALRHLHVQVDHVEADFSPEPSSSSRSSQSPRLTVMDMHLFHVTSLPPRHDSGQSWNASPIIIFDSHLSPASKTSGVGAFPYLDVVVDWERPLDSSLKPSLWRSRQLHPGAPKRGVVANSRTPHALTLDPRTTGDHDAEISLLPIHIFVDLQMIAGWVRFIDAATVSLLSAQTRPVFHDPEAEDNLSGDMMFDTPKPRHSELPPDEDVPSKVEGMPSISGGIRLRSPVIRIEMRAPPSYFRGGVMSPRSGGLIVDTCDISAILGGSSKLPSLPLRHPTFTTRLPKSSHRVEQSEKCLVQVEWETIYIAFSRVGESRATTWLTIGPMAPFLFSAHSTSPTIPGKPEVPLPSRISMRSLVVGSDGVSSSSRTHIRIECTIPQLRVSLQKVYLDSLQLWADDITQWVEHLGDRSETEDGTNPSLIGSRFFARPTKSISSSTITSETTASNVPKESSPTEVTIAIAVTDAFVQLWVPRSKEGSFVGTDARPIHLSASDLLLTLRPKPEGKDETVIYVSIMDVKVTDTSSSELQVPLFHLTTPREITAEPQPMINLRFASVVLSDTSAKESRIKLLASGFSFVLTADFSWMEDLANFGKAPEGAFESVIPSERTILSVHIVDGSLQVKAPTHPGAIVVSLDDANFSADLVGRSPETVVKGKITSLWLLCLDHLPSASPFRPGTKRNRSYTASDYWKRTGYAPLTEIRDLGVHLKRNTAPGAVTNKVEVSRAHLLVYLCADSISAISAFGTSFSSAFAPSNPPPVPTPRAPPMVSRTPRDIFASLDEQAFGRAPEFGTTADMIYDDLPSNPEYLDASFGAAAGFRDMTDDDVEGFDEGDEPVTIPTAPDEPGVISSIGGETIRILDPQGIDPVERYWETLAPDGLNSTPGALDTMLRVHNCDVTVSLYAGFDWERTRQIVDKEVKVMRRKLQKIRQLLASGQTPDDSVEDTYTVLFNSVYIGLPPEADELDPNGLIAAIDEELNEDRDETVSQSSWQPLHRGHASSAQGKSERHHDTLVRSKHPSLQFCFKGAEAEFDMHQPDEDTASRLLVMIKDVEILDHIKTSTWKKFLTQMREDSKGNVRETDSNMVRIELVSVRPVPGDPSEEARLRAKILPLRLHVDQDALDFIKKFFAFQDSDSPDEPEGTATSAPPTKEIFFQHVDVFPVDIKLDYKPKRVDYRALREGKTIELMNFFHFDASEMTLRHIEMFGVTGWPRMLDMLNDLWTPDVKANQLADVISGVEPIRSLVNVGSGVADLVLLPIAQYKKDGRIVRGVQKGTTSFVKSTAMEAIKLGAKLANGTQIIFEQAEHVLGGGSHAGQGQDGGMSRSEMLGIVDDSNDEDTYASAVTDGDLSRYANQPGDIREGLQLAYKSLGKNLNSAAQTILAIPMEVYEKSGTEGPVRAVVRAVPIAVLKPMIGASEAVSKTLLGLLNSLDPNIRRDSDEKYKKR